MKSFDLVVNILQQRKISLRGIRFTAPPFHKYQVLSCRKTVKTVKTYYFGTIGGEFLLQTVTTIIFSTNPTSFRQGLSHG
jgi:hypothetical protein